MVFVSAGLAAFMLAAAAPSAPALPLSIGERLIAGGAARAASQLVMYPADALRTLAQTRAGAKTLSQLGLRTLLAGSATTSAFAFPLGAVQFATFGILAPTLGPLYASACGAAASCLISVPQEVIKQRLVTGVYPNFAAAVSTIWRSAGVRGFYEGALPTVSRNVPFVVVCFTTFAMLEGFELQTNAAKASRSGASQQPAASLSAAQNLRIGIISALAGGLATQPFDVVKTRMMTQAATSAAPYASVADCVSTMWRSEGPTSFYAGLKQRSMYMGPLWAIQFAANARLSRALLARRERRAVEIGSPKNRKSA